MRDRNSPVAATTTGVAGLVTNASDVPVNGSATYTGKAILAYAAPRGSALETFGDATVDADFTANKANLKVTGLNSTVAVHELRVNNMKISGNGFSGGTAQTFQNGRENTSRALGTLAPSRTEGAFFGRDATNTIPDEVGGVVLESGTRGTIGGAFVAD